MELEKAILHGRQQINAAERSAAGSGNVPRFVKVDITHLQTLVQAANTYLNEAAETVKVSRERILYDPNLDFGGNKRKGE